MLRVARSPACSICGSKSSKRAGQVATHRCETWGPQRSGAACKKLAMDALWRCSGSWLARRFVGTGCVQPPTTLTRPCPHRKSFFAQNTRSITCNSHIRAGWRPPRWGAQKRIICLRRQCHSHFGLRRRRWTLCPCGYTPRNSSSCAASGVPVGKGI